MMCTSPGGDHATSDEEVLCPLHREVALARLEPVRPTKPSAPLAPPEVLDGFMTGRVEIEDESGWRADGLNRPARHLRIIGKLTLHAGTSAEGCRVDGEIEARATSHVDNCHVVDLGAYADEYNDEPSHLLTVATGATVKNSTATQIEARAGSRPAARGGAPRHVTTLSNCHAYRAIQASPSVDNLILDGCTAGLTITVQTPGLSLSITHPSQALLVIGDIAKADRFEYPAETTIVIERGHQMFEPLVAATTGDDNWATGRIAAMKAIVTRPEDCTQGPWVDARNSAAWDMIFDPRGHDFPAASIADEEIALALALYPNQ